LTKEIMTFNSYW